MASLEAFWLNGWDAYIPPIEPVRTYAGNPMSWDQWRAHQSKRRRRDEELLLLLEEV